MPDTEHEPMVDEAIPESSAQGGPESEGGSFDAHRDEFLGMRIGGATLQTRIGEGGMGLVYRGWQDPPGRPVAVKLLREAVASEEARYRFAHETRVLASLRHPVIAQLYRAGTHHAPREIPYYLMEFVPDAKPIARFVGEAGLGADETVALFTQVCRGVQSGHAKGIIHRDLKPANVLVDDAGTPKIIDFGIARMLDEDADDDTPRTRTGQMMGSLPYMSPEQFLGSRSDVDTRTDVYALGVILYELLTGRLPYDIEGRSVLEVVGAIQNRPPEPPARLRPELAGDLSVILLKALAKEPDQRYASAEALADELDRYLERRPILARPPRLTYQIRMYARRHRAAFLAMLAVAVTLVGSLVAISVFAASESRARARAEREEARARSLLHETARFVPEVADHLDHKLSAIVGTTRVRMLLAEKLDGLASRLAAIEGASRDPEVAHAVGAAELAVARVRGGTGSANTGESEAALEGIRRAVRQFGLAAAVRPDEERFREAHVSALGILATQHLVAGRYDEARRVLGEVGHALEDWETRSANSTALLGQRIDLLRSRGHLASAEGDGDAALGSYRAAFDLVAAYPWTPDLEEARTSLLLQSRLDLATSYAALERREEARREFDALARLARGIQVVGSSANRAELLWHVTDKLGNFAAREKRWEDARAFHTEALRSAERLVERDPNDVEGRTLARVSRGALGAVLEALGEWEAARQEHAQVVAAVREEQVRSPENSVLPWDLRVALTRLGASESRLAAWEDARLHLDEARAIQRSRAEAYPDRPEEREAVSEVEYTDALYHVARAEVAETTDQGVLELERAVEHLERATSVLEALRTEETLSLPGSHNLELWRDLARVLEEHTEGLRRSR